MSFVCTAVGFAGLAFLLSQVIAELCVFDAGVQDVRVKCTTYCVMLDSLFNWSGVPRVYVPLFLSAGAFLRQAYLFFPSAVEEVEGVQSGEEPMEGQKDGDDSSNTVGKGNAIRTTTKSKDSASELGFVPHSWTHSQLFLYNTFTLLLLLGIGCPLFYFGVNATFQECNAGMRNWMEKMQAAQLRAEGQTVSIPHVQLPSPSGEEEALYFGSLPPTGSVFSLNPWSRTDRPANLVFDREVVPDFVKENPIGFHRMTTILKWCHIGMLAVFLLCMAMQFRVICLLGEFSGSKKGQTWTRHAAEKEAVGSEDNDLVSSNEGVTEEGWVEAKKDK